MERADVLCGYTVYVDLVKHLYPGKETYVTPMTRELERCRWALETAAAGRTVAMVCSGDAGVYGICLLYTSPVPELLDALRRARVPEVVGDLAVLIYRYIFILFATFRSMRDAAASRLGYAGPVRSLRTTGRVYGGLLAHSFRRAQACFDAMEIRCYDGGIRFLKMCIRDRQRRQRICGAGLRFQQLRAQQPCADTACGSRHRGVFGGKSRRGAGGYPGRPDDGLGLGP